MKKKFNIIDIIIVVSILLIIGISIYRAVSVKISQEYTADKTIVYTISSTELDSIYAKAMKNGDELYLSDKGVSCGKITNVTSEYVKVPVEYISDNGFTVTGLRVNPSKINVTVTVECTGVLNDSLMYLGNEVYVSKGTKAEFYTNAFTFDGIITDFKEITND